MAKRKTESTSDVELYCKIRQCDLQNDHDDKLHFIGQLSSNHAIRCVEELLKCKRLASALDKPLRIKALRDGWSISQWHKYSKYSEESLQRHASKHGLFGIDCAIESVLLRPQGFGRLGDDNIVR